MKTKYIKKISIKRIAYLSLIIVLFLIAFYLRLKAMIIRPVIFDEAFTITHLIKFKSIEKMIFADPSVPPLHYLLIKLMSHVSTGILWLRIPSLIFSILGLWISYKFAKKISKKVALLVLIMLSFSNFHLIFSWQAYVYSQLFFLGITNLYLFFHVLNDKNIKYENLKIFLIFISGIMAFLTHYGFVWTIAGLAIVLFHKIILAKFDHKKIAVKHKKLILIGLSTFLFLLSYSPIIIYNFNKALKNIAWFDPINIYSVGQSFQRLLGFYDWFSWNIFLSSNFSKIFSSVFLICMLIYLIKLKDKKVNFLITISLANLLLPIISSLIAGQNLHASRAIITSSFTITALFAIFIEKIFKKKFFYLFLIIFSIFYINFSKITNRNYVYVSQEFDLIKQYVRWFRKHPKYLKEERPIFIYNKNHLFSSRDTFINYFVFNYYWFGYNNEKPLYEYSRIKKVEEIQQKNFYLLTVSKLETEEELNGLCPNKETLRIARFSDTFQQKSDLYYHDNLDVFIYECNPKQ